MTQAVFPLGSSPLRICSASRRVLMLSTAMCSGAGAEEQVLQLAYGLQDRGWGVHIVALLPPWRMPADFAARGIPLSHLNMRKGIPDPAAIGRYNQIVRKFRPDVVHTHLVHANLLGRIARVTQPVPALVSTLHSLTMTGIRRDWSPVFELAHRLTDGWCERTTAICHAAAEHAVRRRAVPSAKMTVLQNGIDTRRFAPNPALREATRRELGLDSKFVWLAVGRLVPQKAYPVLLKAMRRLKDDNDSILLICGQGPLQKDLERLATQLGVESRVRFLGMRQDVPAVMNAADAMVLSSDIEGLPLVLLQASATGLPIVSTDVGGNREAVVDGFNGFLVPSQAPDRLAEAMVRVMAMPAEQRKMMGKEGRARTRQLFDSERVVDRWVELYETLLEGPRAGMKAAAGYRMRLADDR